jgi:2-dehydro-3-deoxy-D-arabinonate dehydratase
MTYLPSVGRQKRWGWVREGAVYPLEDQAVVQVLTNPTEDGLNVLASLAASAPDFSLEELDTEPGRYGHPSLVAPLLSNHEVWAAGVTYESSKFARMAESESGGDFYAKVYVADRPELFLKATPSRTVGQRDIVGIRPDSHWNVPEPELGVLIAATGQILGYTVGNDMSSRDIEGANPLYLPQAKVYRNCCGLGPVIVPANSVEVRNLAIHLKIERDGKEVFLGETSTARMRRTPEEIAGWLFRGNDFPQGVVLLTGTGVVPPDEFSLQAGDMVHISIEGIGTLTNTVGVI